MKYIIIFFILAILLISGDFAFSQKYTISGYVRDQQTGEELIGANIFIKDLSKGTITNTYGFYSLTFPAGEYTISCSFLGYTDYSKKIKLDKDIKNNILLSESVYMTKEVVIVGEKPEDNVESTQMGTVRLPVESIKKLPAIFGEVDIMKTIQLLPGVQSGGEGNSGFYVRGGGPDQNLILLDEAVVYNASHLFGFFSVFNSDAVKDVNLIKGGMPAQYGGRLSSVLDISMNEGNMKTYHADGGIGLISSRLTLQGPIKKDTCSFVVSGRRTYIDVLTDPFIRKEAKAKGSGYYFYDLNAKVNYRFSDKDRLYLSGYFGRDVFIFKHKEAGFNVNIPWGNATTSLRWNHLFSDKMFVNTSAIFSDYNFEFQAEQDEFEMKLFSGIRDYNFKIDFTYIPEIRHNIKFGINHTYHVFTPSSASARIGETEFDTGDIIKQYAHESAIYINDDFDFNEFFKVSVGLRASSFIQVGPFTRYTIDQFGRNEDTTVYSPGEKIADFQNVEPRLSMRYTINSNTSLKAAYTQNYQYIHMATISSVSLPTDVWVSSSTLVKPQYGQQYAIGIFKNFWNNKVETSIEVYYKKLKNQISYKEGRTAGDDAGSNSDNNFTFGLGESYGAEFFIKKRIGNTTGWIGYTLSKTTRQFDDINNGNKFPAKYDRTHDISFILTHNFNNEWSASVVFVYATGNTATMTVGRYMIDGRIISEYGQHNGYRMEPY
ncbi:MAG: TonB-dependent receptor, partial [Bacteroidota bacterium]